MDAGVLFSGGKDSSLAALLLGEFYDVTLVHVGFGVGDAATHAEATADALGFPFAERELDAEVGDEVVAQLREDGFQRNGIQMLHERALDAVAGDGYDAVADGTRRDDRVPSVSRAWAQSLEERHDIDYLSPLAGFGRRAVDRLAEETLEVEEAPAADLEKGDYEGELRELVREAGGDEAVEEVFPEHMQTRVTGRRA
ncbi:alpha hydrolase [Halosegnis rubeus]|jgi:predicted subunit of tRNA(5-methylaminomethyl-2-thiouridylate) methyltransferase|uniref:Alpha hydrolase n=1 Tax=Halosegnis rubeus TaxID=2212850 RepID=A0A5N5UL49_9EURY|nr:alpha hydrolase [Halosegnis rubeus]KAB7514569.1 alpha hydrolase [Halosegnis rubeus]KAB7517902.1 alpha hydrolase [Halosegnis rubeus]KAB7519518.1 alpha hydrolase [Halosegnis rubeus]